MSEQVEERDYTLAPSTPWCETTVCTESRARNSSQERNRRCLMCSSHVGGKGSVEDRIKEGVTVDGELKILDALLLPPSNQNPSIKSNPTTSHTEPCCDSPRTRAFPADARLLLRHSARPLFLFSAARGGPRRSRARGPDGRALSCCGAAARGARRHSRGRARRSGGGGRADCGARAVLGSASRIWKYHFPAAAAERARSCATAPAPFTSR